MARPRGRNWKHLGNVGVDSGQLMVCDPGYVDSQWKSGTRPQGHPAEVLTQAGKKRFPDNKDWSWRFNDGRDGNYDTPRPELGGLSLNQAREQGLVTALRQPVINEFSYRGACSLTNSEESAGEMGLGTGVVFSSGYGDGCYEVWGRFNEDDRIVEVRVLMG